MRRDGPTPTRLRRALVGASMVALSVTLVAGSGATAASPASAEPGAVHPSPDGVSASDWAWVVGRHPSTASYTPAPEDRGNSAGGVNTVAREGEGSYTVTLPGLSNDAGMVQVTALGASSHLCIAEGWGAGVSSIGIDIRCFTRAGDPADTPFSLSWLAVTGGSGGSDGRIGYLWADQPAAADYTPSPYYNYDSSNPGVTYSTIHRIGTGRYIVRMPGLGSTHGHVQVVAYGATAACRVITWNPEPGAMLIRVTCRDIAGAQVDASFDLTFLKSVGLKGFSGTRSAYLWADRPTSLSYHPAKAYRFSTAGTAPTVKRAGPGRYSVTLPGMPKGGAANVTAYGQGKVRCNLSSIRTTRLPQTIGVRCYDIAGHLADSRFTLGYLR